MAQRERAFITRAASTNADAVADAGAAGEAGRFGLVWNQYLGSQNPTGILCAAPVFLARQPLIAARIPISDVQPPPPTYSAGEAAVEQRRQREYRYYVTYNQALVSHPRFPYRDICASAAGPLPRDYGSIDDRPKTFAWSGQTVSRTGSLGEAARRGDRAEVRRWLASGGDLNRPDDFGMTPLDWALAHQRTAAALEIKAAGGGTSYEPLP